MTNKEPSSFIIDIQVLQQSSKRPFHLEQRMRFRKLQPKLTIKAAEINRKAFLDERRSKLTRKYLASRQLRNQHYKHALDQENNKKIQLNRLLESAEAKRHLIMATQAKSCALAVMRAKEVARLHILRTEKEREHRRIELDIRINRSSQRRNCILRKIGSKFTSSSESANLTPLDAALNIQRWWRQLNFTPMIGNFKRFDLSLASVQKLDFPVIAVRLKSKPLLKAAATLLIRSRRISPLYSTQSRYRNSVKVFMTSYLISVHPQEIVGEVDGKFLSSQLCKSAKKMLQAFELWINSLGESNFYTKLHRFLVLWDEYYFDFEAWRSSDVRKLVENMSQHFIELDMVWNKVRGGNQEEDQAWGQEIIRQREEIKSQIRNIGGEEAVQELLEKQRLARQAHFEPLVSPSFSNLQPGAEKIKLPEDSVMPSYLASTTSQSSTNYEKLEETISQSQLMQDFSEINSGLSIRQLAHEIIMNPDFKLASKSDPLTKKVKDIATRAFFDSFREKIAANKADSMLISLLAEVRGKIIQLLPPRGHFSSNFQFRFDMKILEQQITQNTFQPLEWITYIGETLRSICAPIRDDEVSKITSFSDPVDAFKFIFEQLDILLLDHLNYQIMGIRPLLTNQAVYFEAKYFDKLLNNKEIVLIKTQTWLDSAVQETRNAILARNLASVSEQSSWPSYESLFADALITLLFSQSPINLENCPETLDLDANRLLDIQNEIQRLTVASALVVICQNITGDGLRAVPELQSELKDELLVLLNDSSTTIDNLGEHLAQFLAVRVNRFESNELPSDQKEFLINMVRKTVSYRDSVYLVLARRMQRVLKQIILSSSDQTLPSSATLASYGLGIVSKEITQVGTSIKNIATFNRQVYAKHYDTILSNSLLKAMHN